MLKSLSNLFRASGEFSNNTGEKFKTFVKQINQNGWTEEIDTKLLEFVKPEEIVIPTAKCESKILVLTEYSKLGGWGCLAMYILEGTATSIIMTRYVDSINQGIKVFRDSLGQYDFISDRKAVFEYVANSRMTDYVNCLKCLIEEDEVEYAFLNTDVAVLVREILASTDESHHLTVPMIAELIHIYKKYTVVITNQSLLSNTAVVDVITPSNFTTRQSWGVFKKSLEKPLEELWQTDNSTCAFLKTNNLIVGIENTSLESKTTIQVIFFLTRRDTSTWMKRQD